MFSLVSVFESRVEYENKEEKKTKQASQGQRTVFPFCAVCYYTYRKEKREE